MCFMNADIFIALDKNWIRKTKFIIQRILAFLFFLTKLLTPTFGERLAGRYDL